MTHQRPPPKTNAQLQADQRQREKARGLKRKTVLIPADKERELNEIVRQWRSHIDPETPQQEPT